MKDFDGKFMDLSNKKFGAKIKEMMKKIKEMEKKIEKMRNIAPTLSNYLAQIVKDKEHLKIPIMAADNAFSALQIFVDSYYLKKKDKKYPENDKDENNKWVMDAIVQVDIDKKIEKRIQRMVDLHEEIEKAKRAGRWPHPESCYEMMIEWTYVSAWYSKII